MSAASRCSRNPGLEYACAAPLPCPGGALPGRAAHPACLRRCLPSRIPMGMHPAQKRGDGSDRSPHGWTRGAAVLDRYADIDQHLLQCHPALAIARCVPQVLDRKSTRLNSSHVAISYAVFCLKKKNNVVDDYTH